MNSYIHNAASPKDFTFAFCLSTFRVSMESFPRASSVIMKEHTDNIILELDNVEIASIIVRAAPHTTVLLLR